MSATQSRQPQDQPAAPREDLGDQPVVSSAAPTACPALEALSREAAVRLKQRARVIKALAHPTRLYIVERLAERPHCVCELAALVAADMSTVSKHLSVLRAAGIVDDEKRGSQVWYSLRVPCILNFFGCIEAVLNS
jgi:DNA-binding transcriptional ArsR family regulator